MDYSKWTPIRCSQTKESVLLGDKVRDFKGNSGFLDWDECFNSYYIRTVDGGKINTHKYIKTKELTKNYIDSTTVECRTNHLKKKW